MKASQSARSATISAITGLQVESWRLLWTEMTESADAMAELQRIEARRREVRPALLDLLGRFLSGALDVAELRGALDETIRTTGDVFRMGGPSGVMFLGQLARYVPDAGPLAAELRATLPVPGDIGDARRRLRQLTELLGRVRRSSADAQQIQPGRAAFLSSIWWHLQEPERWPAFHLSTRRALRREEGLFTPSGDAVEDYVAARDVFIALASTLRLSGGDMEFLCRWSLHREAAEEPTPFYEPGRLRAPRAESERVAPVVFVRERDPESVVEQPRGVSEHAHAQWLLAKIGRQLGCRVWIAANDRKREWKGEALGSLSIDKLPPLGLDPASRRLIGLIDVVWLRGPHQVVAAFEVEQTTSVYSGLLRMADLAALSPNLNFPLYIVTPEERLEKVRRELTRPTFRALELDRRCGFFSIEALAEAAAGVMRYGSGPKAIDSLAQYVSAADEGV